MNNILREIRKSKGLSIRKLSIESGVSERSITNIENKKAIPCLKNAMKLSIALQVSVENIFTLEDNDYS